MRLAPCCLSGVRLFRFHVFGFGSSWEARKRWLGASQGESGIVYLADDFGLCSERYKIGSPLTLLEYYHPKDLVVVITKNVLLAQFSLDAEGHVRNETKLKLSCGPHPESLQGVWAGEGLLATVARESLVRFWNLADDENYILSLQGVESNGPSILLGDKITCLDYNARRRALVVGTQNGNMVQWRCSTLQGTPTSEADWQPLPVVEVGGRLVSVQCGPTENLLDVVSDRGQCTILSETQLSTAVSPPLLAVQVAPTKVLVYSLEQQRSVYVEAPFRIAGGICVGPPFVVIWSNHQVSTYELEMGSLNPTHFASFTRENTSIAAVSLLVQGSERALFVASGSKIEVCTLQGVMKKTLPFSPEVEGLPTMMDVRGSFLAAATSKNAIRVWNVSRTQPKPIGAARKFEDGEEGTLLGEIRSIRCNCDGTRVSILADQRVSPTGDGTADANGRAVKVPDPHLFVYDSDSDTFLKYHVGKNRVPINHTWESSDPRLLACETEPKAMRDEEGQQDLA